MAQKPVSQLSHFGALMTDSEATPTGLGAGWYVRRRSRIRGPLTSAKIRHHVLDGRLQLSDEVSRDRIDWRPIAAVQEVTPLQLRRDNASDRRARERLVSRERRRAVLSTSLASAMAVIAIGFTVWLSGRGPDLGANCAAEPAPGVNWSSCRLDGLARASARLAGANLQNASLINARLNDADLTAADLSYANLTGAQLGYVQLAGARLLGTNLRVADLTHADLSHANLAYADLTGARLGGTSLAGVRLDGAIWLDGRRCSTPSVGGCR